MTIGCSIPTRGPAATPENLRGLATRIEDLGYDHLWVSDHIVLPTQVASRYPYDPKGVAPFTTNPSMPYWDPLAALCFLAACTRRIRLGTHVLVVPYRDPVVTAKTVATLDQLSAGRVILGVGVGWMEEEFKALGLDTFAERGRVTDEYIGIFKELWTQDDPQFDGKYRQFSGIKFEPKPVQKPHVPIWVGGHTPPAIRRAARLGDGWLPIGLRPPAELEPEELAESVNRLRDMSEAAGRPREAVDIVFSTTVAFGPSHGGRRRTLTGSAEEIAADMVFYQQVGVQHFILGFPGDVDSADQWSENMERFAKEVMPRVA